MNPQQSTICTGNIEDFSVSDFSDKVIFSSNDCNIFHHTLDYLIYTCPAINKIPHHHQDSLEMTPYTKYVPSSIIYDWGI